MKKTLSFVLAASLCISMFAADILNYTHIKGEVKSYTRTDFSIASKFGNYYRTPSVKVSHIFDPDGREIESSELSPKNVVINTISSSYDNNGNLTTQVCTSAEGESIWRTEIKYDNNMKSEISEYDSKNSLKAKTFFKYDKGNLVDETSYDGEGDLVWKIIYKYTSDNLLESINQYSADGNLSEKEVYTYDEGAIASIKYYDNLLVQNAEEIFRYNTDGSLNEITTYDVNKQITKRVVIKYEKQGNPVKVSEWAVAKKFGTTVNELKEQYEYEYNYSEDLAVQMPELPAVSDEAAPTVEPEESTVKAAGDVSEK